MLIRNASRPQETQVLKAAVAGIQGFLLGSTSPAESLRSSSCGSASRSFNSDAGDGYNSGGMESGSGGGARRGGGGGRRGGWDSPAAVAKELRKQCEASAREALEQQTARMVMNDPIAQLMASRGMPLGINVRHKAGATPASHSSSSASAHGSSGVSVLMDAHMRAEAYAAGQPDMEHAVFRRAQPFEYDNDYFSKGGYRSWPYDQHAEVQTLADVAIEVKQVEGQDQREWPVQVAQQANAESPPEGGGSRSMGDGAGSNSDGESGDGGGKEETGGRVWEGMTTSATSAEIAQQIADSNAELARMAAEAEASKAGMTAAHSGEEDDLQLGPEDAKYKTLEQMSADIKGLDEVFELLASVPWLDEDDVKQRELKGMAMVTLLGTLEDVGFNIRPYVERIWAGESDNGMLQSCTEAKDQAAVLSVLFHTRKITEEYGAPPGRDK